MDVRDNIYFIQTTFTSAFIYRKHSKCTEWDSMSISAQTCRTPCPIPQPVRGLTLLLCPCLSTPVSHAVFYTKKDLNFHLFSVSMSGTSGLIILVSNVKLRVEPPGCENYPLRDTILGYK